MFTITFFLQKSLVFNETSRHLAENNMSNIQIVWVILKKYQASISIRVIRFARTISYEG